MDNNNFIISQRLSKLLSKPTNDLTIKDIQKCKESLIKIRREVSVFTDARRVSHNQERRYQTNYTKQQYEYLKSKKRRENLVTKRNLSIIYADAYNAIMMVREFFTNQEISYTGSILSKNKQVIGSFTISREEFFESMSFSTEYSKKTNTVILKVVKQLKDFQNAVNASILNTELTEKQQNSKKYMDTIHLFNDEKQEVYENFLSVIKDEYGDKTGIGGWAFEGFNRMYHTTKLTDSQETSYLHHLINLDNEDEFNPGEGRTKETYENYIIDLMSFIRTGVAYGFQSGDVNTEQIKKGKAEIISGTYLIATLDELCSIFDNLEQGCFEKAEQGLLNIFTKDPGASEFISETEKATYKESMAHIKETVQEISNVSIKENLTN